MKLIVLHLSDIHFKAGSDDILQKRAAIAEAAFEELALADVLLIAISGDVAFGGTEKQYNIARDFLTQLRTDALKRKDLPVFVAVAPGNHDCDFSAVSPLRGTVISGLLQDSQIELTQEHIDCCTSVQSQFFSFKDSISPLAHRIFMDSLFEVYDIPVGAQVVRLQVVNSSWLSQKKETVGRLLFPFAKYESITNDSAHLCITIFHHPFNWYAPGPNRDFFAYVKATSDFVLLGHEHEQSAAMVSDTNNMFKETEFIEGGSLQPPGSEKSSFNVLLIDLEAEQHKVVHFRLSSEGKRHHYKRTEIEDSWRSSKALPPKSKNDLVISPFFEAQLMDAGAIFHHPNKREVNIDDVFVYPDLRFANSEGPDTERVSSKILEQPSQDDKYYLISGEDTCGKTTLAFRIFRAFHQMGKAPLYVEASEIATAGTLDLRKMLNRTIERSYGRTGEEKFWRREKDDRVLVLDNFERIAVAERYRHRVLEHLHASFGRVYLVTSSVLQIDELFIPEGVELLKQYRVVEILRLGHRLRHELINRWNSIGADDTFGAGDLLAKNDRAEKVVNTVIGKMFVPPLPLYLLTILQSLEAGTPSELQHNGFGHHYHYLIVLALKDIKVESKDLSGFFNYLACFAYEFFSMKRKELSDDELKAFNDKFSSEYTAVNLSERLNALVASKIVLREGRCYSFRYPYIYYYFVALYLARNIREAPIRETIKTLCQHLHYADYANIIVFIAHHTSDPLVLDELSQLADQFFTECAPLKLEDDVATVNGLVQSLPKGVYKKTSPVQHRKEQLDLKDQADSIEKIEPQAGPDDKFEDLSFPAKLTTAFKAVDIIGQILRNYYAELKKPQKVKLLEKAVSSALRALKKVMDSLSADPEGLLELLKHVVAEHRPTATEEQRQELAQRLLFGMFCSMVESCVWRIADSTGSQNLTEEFNIIHDKNPSVALELVRMAIKLDIPNKLPFTDIQENSKKFEKNALAYSLLQGFVLRHLYMYYTSDQDKQKLCSMVKISVVQQRGIDQQSRRTKLIGKAKRSKSGQGKRRVHG